MFALFTLNCASAQTKYRRYKENLYLKSVLEGIGNHEIPIHELSGFDHGGAGWPGRILMMQ